MLFIATMFFIFIVFIQLLVFGSHKFSGDTPITFTEFSLPYTESTFYSWMKTLSCFLVAFSFTINLFPIYSGLKVKTNQYCQNVVNHAITSVLFIYLFLSVSSCFLFGLQITAVDANVILNINSEYQTDKKRWESFVLRALFMVVLACHIPFVFFSGKEAMLIIIDEIDRRSISKTLDERVKQLKAIG